MADTVTTTTLDPVQLAQATPNVPATVSGADIRVILSEVKAGSGDVEFKLPIASSAISSVEVVDLDLVLVTNTGERLLLPQAALQATTAANTTMIRFSNGSTELVADQIKKIGLVKPVEGGSYRIQASQIKPQQAGSGAKDGNDFGLGKEAQDSKAAEVQAEIQQQVAEQVQKITQTLQNASVSNAQTESANANAGAAKGTGTGAATNSLASASPGSPPNTNTSTQTADPNLNKGNGLNDNPSQLDTARNLQHMTTAKLNAVTLVDGSKVFGDIKLDALLPSSPLAVNVVQGNAVGPAGVGLGNGTVGMDFLMPGRTGAATVQLSLTSGNLPPGFTIDGKTVTSSGITLVVSSADVRRFALNWNVAADGSTVVPSDFQIGVKFFDAKGQLVVNSEGVGASPITFHYDDYRTIAQFSAMGNDTNSNPKFYLPAFGLSYDVNGSSSADVINAGDGHDVIRGGLGNDTISGGRGDDTLIGGGGTDNLDGGTGNNTASYVGSDAGVTVNLVTGVVGVGGHAQGDVLTNIQNLMGSDFADTLIGNANANRLEGGADNDTLIGGAGADTLDGGAGSDTASYINAAARPLDTVTTNSGVIASLADPSANRGDAADDTYISIENLRGSEFDDLLMGDSAANKLDGGAGDDTLIGGAGADTLIGGAGSDTASYTTALSAVVVNLTDSTQNLGTDAAGDAYNGIENLIGSDYSDKLVGDGDINILNGGAGDDTLVGGNGGDILIGGEGSDTASYAGTNAVRANLANPTSSTLGNTGDAIGDTYNSIENLQGSDAGDTLIGDARANILWGGKGDDTLMGGGGGGDNLQGGDGNDTASYENAISAVEAHLALTEQSLDSGAAVGDTYASIENLKGSDYNDLLVGDAAANLLSGGKGNDTLIGGVGTDKADTLNGGEGFDTVSYINSTSAVILNLGSGGSGGDANGDQYVSIENAVGTDFDDQIQGDSADNTLSGGVGNDLLVGAGGNDSLLGGDGDDVLKNTGSGQHYYDGGIGTNTVSYEGFTTALNLNLTAIDGNTNGAGGSEYFSNIQNLIGGTLGDVLTGNSQVNSLNGKDGDDTLFGGGGNDVLLGGSGSDVLDGGAGADILNGEAGGADVVTYSQSTQGLVIDLANATVGLGRGTGDALGDTFDGIEIIEGSSRSDYIYAGGSVTNIIYRGLGGNSSNSIVVGGGTFNGDTVDFSGSTAGGVTIDLALNTEAGVGATGGLAIGAKFASIENLVGSSTQADTLKGDAFANQILGGGGDDTLLGSLGNTLLNSDTLDGGLGIDTASYENFLAANAITANMSAVSGGYFAVTIGGGAQVDRLKGFENIRGTAGGDSITGDDGDNKLEGLAGNDTLNGGAGADSLLGGDGDDVLQGGAGADVLDGGASVVGGVGDWASYANAAARTLGAGATVTGVVVSLLAVDAASYEGDAVGDTFTNIENLRGSAFNDKLTGDDNDNRVEGGDGSDTLDGGAGNDTLLGGNGDDTLLSSAGADSFSGGAGNDAVTYAAIAVNLTIDLRNTTVGGGVGTLDSAGDVIGTDVETVIGGSGSDLFLSGNRAGSLSINGGTDALGLGIKNTVSYENATGILTASLDNGTANAGAATGDSYVNIQDLIGSAQNDILRGDANNNVLSGGNGADTLLASLGNDTLFGGTSAANDASTDTVSFVNITSAVSADLSVGTATFTVNGVLHTTTTSGIEALIGSGFNDSLTGSTANDTLDGGAGNDTLNGGAGSDKLDGGVGNDTLDGGADNDTLIGGAGTDSLIGGAGADVVDYSAVTTAITIDLANTTLGFGSGTGDAAGDVIDSSVETVWGSANAASTFYGRTTAVGESLVGGSANDTFFGSAGNDTLDGAAGTGDTVDYSASTAVRINLGTNVNTGGDAQGDQLNNVEVVIGSAGNDTLTGGTIAIIFRGGAGNDSITGSSVGDQLFSGDGNDTLVGGNGDDVFDVRTGNTSLASDSADGGNGNDTIVINQSASVFTLNGGAGTDTLQFYATAAGTLDMKAVFGNNDANYQNLETLDLSADTVSTQAKIGASAIRALCDNGNASTLTLKLRTGADTYTIDTTDTASDSFSITATGVTFTNAGATVATLTIQYV